MYLSPHVITCESRPVVGASPIWRARCALCRQVSPWSFSLSKSVDAVWFAPTYVPQSA